MTKKLMFDTLDYAKILAEGGVEHADVHSTSLATAIVQNIYTKDEVDKMIEATFKEFAKRTREYRHEAEQRANEYKREADERINQTKLEMKEIENRIDKAFNRYTYTTISILGALIVVVSAISTFAHFFITKF